MIDNDYIFRENDLFFTVLLLTLFEIIQSDSFDEMAS